MTRVSTPDALSAARQHAQACAAAGDLQGARAVLERAVDMGRSTFGEDDPEVLRTLLELARVHRQTDDAMATRRTLEEAYAAGQWRLGDADPLMLEVSFDLAVVVQQLGNLHEARKAFTRVAQAGPAVLGEQHWAVTRARDYLSAEDAQAFSSPTSTPPPQTLPVEQTSARPMGPPPQHQTPGDAPTEILILPGPTRPIASGGAASSSAARIAIVNQPVPAGLAGSSAMRTTGPPASPGGRRGATVFAVIAAALAAVLAVAALVFVVASQSRAPTTRPRPIVTAPAPTVSLDVDGTTITVRWVDPSGGAAPFVVLMWRPNEVAQVVGKVVPGRTEFRMLGLRADLDYCFSVSAVYATDRIGISTPVCTQR